MKTKVFASLASLLVLACVLFVAVPSRADAISDILIVRNPAGNISQQLSTLESQEGNGGGIEAAVGGFGTQFITEVANTSQVIDVTYLLDSGLRRAGWTATFQSEFIPEPSTMVLLGAGLLGLAALARRRMKP